MQTLVIGDQEAMTGKVRQILSRAGHECPPTHVLPLDHAAERLAEANPELLVVTLSPHPERALAVLDQLHVPAHVAVVVVGPVSDPRLMLRVMRGGVSDYVSEAELETELPAAMLRLQSKAI